MMKRIALVLCLAAAACGGKSDSSESKPAASESSDSTSGESGTSGNRSSKVELPPRRAPTVDTQSPEEANTDARRQRGPRDPAKWEARQKERQAEMDTDGDGKVSDAERAAARKLRIEERMTRLDTDGDGKLSKEEVAASRFRRVDFDAADANKDGFLSMEELDAAAMRANMGPRGQRGFGRGDRIPRDGSGAPAPAPADPAQP